MPRRTGEIGEEYTVQWLQYHGFRIVARNYHSRYGEIDIIAEDDQYILFVEVKTRREGAMVSPEASVTKKKQEKILLTAQKYLVESQCALQPRFDLAAVTMLNDRPLGLQYYPDAFGA